MNTAVMRRIDQKLGRPMCAVLTAVRRVTDPLRTRPPERPRRILVVKLAEQGAWVVAYSAILDAIDMVGRENVFLMTFSENRFVLDQLELVPAANVIEVRTTGPVRTLVDVLRGVRRARKERVDAAVDFEFFARSSTILCYLSGASRRVGFHRSAREASYRGDLLTHRLSFNPRLHVSETFRVIVQALLADPGTLPALAVRPQASAPPPLVAVSDAERERVVRKVLGLNGGSKPPDLILLNANAGDLLPLRRWPTERYVHLARRLLDAHPDVVVAFTGSPSEARDAERLARSVDSPRCISVGGRTTLRELLVLYSMAEVLVTNDSGPAHYAALAPIDIVTLFGPESPHIFGSLSPRNHPLWAELPCSPCVNAYNDRVTACRDNLCMQHLSVERVLNEVSSLYEQRRRARVVDGRAGETAGEAVVNPVATGSRPDGSGSTPLPRPATRSGG